MNTKKRNAIHKLAENILKALDVTVPVDIEEIVKKLGGTIRLETHLENDMEAMVRKVNESFEISLLDNKPEVRRRFSIAHELGHLFIHMGYLINPELWAKEGEYKDSVYYRYGYNEEETEANEFAAALLMPTKEFKKIARNNYEDGIYYTGRIAEHFGVSVKAAELRGQWLGLFSWED